MSKSKLSICLKLILVIAIASTLFSCKSQGVNLETLDPNLYDQSWLTGKPCGAPCWYGLEPGVSSREDSISKTKQLPFINGNNGAALYPQGASFLCKKPQDLYCVNMTYESGILETLSLVPNYQIAFEQAVEELGNPDGFLVLPIYPETEGCYLQVVWKNKGLELKYEEGVGGIFSFREDLCEQVLHKDGKLPKNILVQNVEIMLPSKIESIMQNDSLKPWKGFAN